MSKGLEVWTSGVGVGKSTIGPDLSDLIDLDDGVLPEEEEHLDDLTRWNERQAGLGNGFEDEIEVGTTDCRMCYNVWDYQEDSSSY